MVKYWMHNGLMRAGEKGKVGGKSDRESSAQPDSDEAVSGKISRSKGAGGLAELIRRHTGERIRFFLLRTHYRSTIVFGEEGLQEAGTALEGFYRFFDRFEQISGTSFYDLNVATKRSESAATDDESLAKVTEFRRKYLAAMDDDFNTGAAMSQLFDLLRWLNRHIDEAGLSAGADSNSASVGTLVAATSVLRELTTVLGLFLKPVVSGGGDSEEDTALLDDVVQLLIELRREAREKKDYAMGDAIRDRLGEIGVALLDGKDGTTWERKSS